MNGRFSKWGTRIYQLPSRFFFLTTRHFAQSSWSTSSPPPATSTTVSGPSTALKSWESGARMIKNTKVKNEYLEHMRDLHDPSLHLKTIEDELKGTIGKALGKQGEKILRFLRLMEQERQCYNDLLLQHKQEGENSVSPSLVESAKKYNEHRASAIQARWELTVHRQAVGFVVNNHRFVQESFPIPEKLPTYVDEANETAGNVEDSMSSNKQPKKQFGDQLDWWQRVGRWR